LASSTRLQLWLSAALAAIGAALVAMMVVVESEPGALPLALLVIGVGWHLVARRRLRAQR
jgi:hypothetical protein